MELEVIILLSCDDWCKLLSLQELIKKVGHGSVEVARADSFLDGAGFEIGHKGFESRLRDLGKHFLED